MKKIDPPTIEETREQLDNLQLDSGVDWDQSSNLSANPPDEKRSSDLLSVLSDGSRRQSILFSGTDEDGDVLTELGSEDASTEMEDDEERKRKRQDEVFVDKTRAAMVVIGTKDIKDALERKKADEILRKTPEARVAHVLFHQARFLGHQNRFREALAILNRALAVDAERKDWLTEKSRCYLHLLQPEEALQVVDQVLKKDPNYFKAIVLKGEILYSLWDLERAMLCFVEGRRMRPDNTDCIRGVHKVKMALEEIAAYQNPSSIRKSKKRSKSAKGRLTTASAMEDLMLSRNRNAPSLSSRRPSSRLSPLSEARTTSPSTMDSPSSGRPSTAVAIRRVESPSISRSPKSELRASVERTVERPLSAKGKRKLCGMVRPKTAAVGSRRKARSRSKSGDPEIADIRRFVRESMSGSYRSTSLRRFSGSTQQSIRSGFSSQSFSSSMEDVSRESEYRQSEGPILPKMKTKPKDIADSNLRNKMTLGTNVSASLGQDRMFLEGLLKDKDLKRSKTAYSRRALKIAREVQGFVSERQKYWRNREGYIRYATSTEEDTLL